MTPKEYLKQAYRLDKRIDQELLKLEELKALAKCTQTVSYEERILSGTKQREPHFVRVLEKVWRQEEKINQQVDKFVDLKEQMSIMIDELENVDHNLVLSYRYVHGWTWEEIARVLHADRSTILRWHSKALSLVHLPEEPILI
ncbi:Protein of unknown function [Pilibacter termitis]|uniref:Sigma-70, region 4 n=1 Tax=Pilibacter termitis TaxID=263852 RepID=A0A1T4PR06_9ENTE|nr:DUF1492 domain-containing protein [Pilibacter termitis]SJZ93975.1 Protein of unknown function [Pilibacter termitis]